MHALTIVVNAADYLWCSLLSSKLAEDYEVEDKASCDRLVEILQSDRFLLSPSWLQNYRYWILLVLWIFDGEGLILVKPFPCSLTIFMCYTTFMVDTYEVQEATILIFCFWMKDFGLLEDIGLKINIHIK